MRIELRRRDADLGASLMQTRFGSLDVWTSTHQLRRYAHGEFVGEMELREVEIGRSQFARRDPEKRGQAVTCGAEALLERRSKCLGGR